ncbi:30S ribosomal protein S12 methylthiotransferase RimO [bacterium]|nr:30S ribosomal protein S12 methylthiotransferase RimO [bacterium]MDB4489511.1 30S ribosomal protein S12 methylthiotransferase RimO [bacterium]MDB4724768.1 30S ribosomal protein S12 methylthiotransferase RimO [Planctomycetota bacterium]
MTVRPADRVALIHLGCARNLIDSELILGRMAEEGLVVTGDPAEAHTVVLNTCSFIGPAREESHGAIRDLVERKQSGELGAVVVAGCLVQRYRRTLERQYPDVDMFAEISDYRALARNIRSMSEGEKHQRYLEGPGLREPLREGARLLATPGSYAYLRISHGCDHTCSFCAIPSIRGPHRSKRPAAVLEEAEELIGAGVKELVIVAEDSTAWGRDLGTELPALVESLADLDGDTRLRVMYAYPNRFPWDLAPLLAEHPKVVPYLDIPVQHAATPVLRAMRRAGSGDQVRRTLDRLRTEVPDLTLRTTVLLGFPGETDEDAAEVVDLIREFGLSRVGAFTYSPEEGTPGFGLEGSVPEEVAMARRDAVLAERDAQLAKTQSGAIGTEVEVLVDEPPDPDGGVIVGRSVHDAPEVDMVTFAAAPDAAVGDRIRVRIEATDEEHNWIGTQVTGDES